MIDVEQGKAEPGKGRAEHAVAFVVFAERQGRGGEIHENVALLAREDVHGMRFIIFVPAVFAEKDAGAEDAFFGRDGKRRKEIFERAAFVFCQNGGAGEVAAVVELAIGGEEGLRREGVGRVLGAKVMAACGDESGVVFPGASVVAGFCEIDGDASPNDGKAASGAGDFVIVCFAFAEKRILIPEVADEVAGEAHLGQNQNVGAGFLGERDFFFDGAEIFANLSGADGELRGLDFHGGTSLEKIFLVFYHSFMKFDFCSKIGE